MRVENGSVDSAAADLYTRPATQSAANTRDAAKTAAQAADQTSLSNAGELVALAKNLMPADRLSHFQAINAAMNTGQYQADPAAVSQAVVSEHLSA
jgi:hypothetical protein